METIKDYYDIAVLPSTEVSQYCVDLSKGINARYGGDYHLDTDHNIPHISLFHTAFSEENLELVKQILNSLSKRFNKLEAEINRFINSPEYKTVTLEVSPKKSFVPLHEEVISQTIDLVDREFDYYSSWSWSVQDKNERKYVDEYTTPLVKENFIPHVTMNTLDNSEDVGKVEEEFELEKQAFVASRLAICTVGRHHSCQEVVHSILLS